MLFICLFCCVLSETARVTETAELSFQINGEDVGSLTIGLFGDIVPKTVRNFRKLCLGWSSGGKFYSYAGSPVHEISFFYRIGLGDVVSGVGHQSETTGGISIYGKKFDDENFELNHYGRGWVSMDNWGSDTNKSSFFITLDEAEFMDGDHVVFGKVIRGSTLLDLLEEEPTHKASDDEHAESTVPNNDILISKCDVKEVTGMFETFEAMVEDEVIDYQFKDEL